MRPIDWFIRRFRGSHTYTQIENSIAPAVDRSVTVNRRPLLLDKALDLIVSRDELGWKRLRKRDQQGSVGDLVQRHFFPVGIEARLNVKGLEKPRRDREEGSLCEMESDADALSAPI